MYILWCEYENIQSYFLLVLLIDKDTFISNIWMNNYVICFFLTSEKPQVTV